MQLTFSDTIRYIVSLLKVPEVYLDGKLVPRLPNRFSLQKLEIGTGNETMLTLHGLALTNLLSTISSSVMLKLLVALCQWYVRL